MGEPARKEITAKEAIDIAFEQFKEFYSGQLLNNVLLEGIEYVPERTEWDVTIGFDIGRSRTKGGQLSFMEKTTEPIREARIITLRSEDGAFVRMTSD